MTDTLDRTDVETFRGRAEEWLAANAPKRGAAEDLGPQGPSHDMAPPPERGHVSDRLINGQQVWTSGAQIADSGGGPFRTDPELPKHQGLSFFIVDMRQPGVDVRPIVQITGESHFNEVFFTDARAPESNIVGG